VSCYQVPGSHYKPQPNRVGTSSLPCCRSHPSVPAPWHHSMSRSSTCRSKVEKAPHVIFSQALQTFQASTYSHRHLGLLGQSPWLHETWNAPSQSDNYNIHVITTSVFKLEGMAVFWFSAHRHHTSSLQRDIKCSNWLHTLSALRLPQLWICPPWIQHLRVTRPICAWKPKSNFMVAKKLAAARPHSWALGLGYQNSFLKEMPRVQEFCFT